MNPRHGQERGHHRHRSRDDNDKGRSTDKGQGRASREREKKGGRESRPSIQTLLDDVDTDNFLQNAPKQDKRR